jgi:cyclic pyranopterin phosphate synthase
MPEKGVDKLNHDEILSFEEILRLVEIFADIGINKVRLTGGEPLVRPGIIDLVEMINNINGIESVVMTTNGVLLKDYADKLKEAGLKRINISLDSLDRKTYKKITRFDKLNKVLSGIKSSRRAGLNPVKINTVVMKNFNTDEIYDFVDMAIRNKLEWRFIEFMPLGGVHIVQKDLFISNKKIKRKIEKKYDLKPIKDAKSLVANVFRIKGTEAKLGFISPLTHKFCHKCNRVRMTADGNLIPCLMSEESFNLKKLVRSNESNIKIKEYINQVINKKPKEHNSRGSINMSKMGG